MIEPRVVARVEDGRELPLLAWPFATEMSTASTASVGGGVGRRQWVVNAQVRKDYARRDLAAHAAELAAVAQLDGPGVVMLTAADVRRVECATDGGVRVDATVGLTWPTWAAAADEAVEDVLPAAAPGTINVVVQLPVRLTDAALLNALCTATEAKTQALFEAGVPGTGTASDAVTVVCPSDGVVEEFAGPRSVWGARLARAVHAATLAGARRWDAGP
jgi:adenosylcobinamide amidohydrolase